MMNNYYLLRDDLYIHGRWILDDPTDCEGRELVVGQRIAPQGNLRAEIHTSGKALDFTMSLLDIPIISRRFASAVRILIQDQAQLFPVHIQGYEGFEVMNTTILVRCLDESRSEFTKWTEEDGRPDKIGHYQMVTRLRVDPNQIPANLHVFRVMGWKIALIVSQAFVDAILPLNPIGPKLELVT